MPARRGTMTFYGAFKSKKKAVRKERKHRGSFIRKIKVRGDNRYVVMKPKRNKKRR